MQLVSKRGPPLGQWGYQVPRSSVTGVSHINGVDLSMSQENTWPKDVEAIVAEQALAMNYEHGITCRVLPLREEDGKHVIELALDLTHSSHDFDLTCVVRFTDAATSGVTTELVAPDGSGKLWEESYWNANDFKRAASGLPFFVHGFIAGRKSHEAAASSEPPASEGPTT
jgi:hypothetical protein